MVTAALDSYRLRYFVAVAEELHFTRAAERLSIAQPALSQHIRRLERALGARLFDRTPRSVRLTDAGLVLLEHARKLLDAEATTRVDVERAARGELGRVTLGFVPTTAGGIVPEAFRGYRKRYPDVVVALHEVATTADLIELLRRDEIQVGVSHYARLDAKDIRTELLRRERQSVVALPAGHPLARQRSVRLDQLWSEQIVTGTPSSPYVLELAAAAAAAGRTPRLIHTSEPATRLVLVAAGVGVVVMLSSAPRLAHRRVAYRPLRDSPLHIDVYASWRAGQRSQRVTAFLDVLRAVARRSP